MQFYREFLEKKTCGNESSCQYINLNLTEILLNIYMRLKIKAKFLFQINKNICICIKELREVKNIYKEDTILNL